MSQIHRKGKRDQSTEPVMVIVDQLGKIPSTLSYCIRSIKTNNAYDAPIGGIDEASFFELSRYIRALSVKVPFYFAAESKLLNSASTEKEIGASDIVQAFRAHELASILALTYVYKRLRTRIAEQEDWNRIAKITEEHIEIGGLLGRALPSIGFADGVLVGGIRQLALGLFAIKDSKGYKEYRRDTKMKGLAFNLAEENQRWATNHLDVAARLLISLGFGQAFTANLFEAISAKSDKELSKEELRLRLLTTWIESLSIGGTPPQIRGEEKHQASEDVLDKLFDDCSRIRRNGLSNHWISMGKKDVSRSSHPQLFEAGELNKSEQSDDLDLGAE